MNVFYILVIMAWNMMILKIYKMAFLTVQGVPKNVFIGSSEPSWIFSLKFRPILSRVSHETWKLRDDLKVVFHLWDDLRHFIVNLRPNLMNLSQGLNLSLGSNFVGSTFKFVINISRLKPALNWDFLGGFKTRWRLKLIKFGHLF